MIEVKECSKAFDTVKAVNKATLDVGVREVFGLVGSNGAGKSTLLRMMAGIIKPDEGEIQIDGMPVYENEEAKKLFFYISDDSYFPTNYTAMDLVRFYRNFYPQFRTRFFHELMEQFHLEENRRIATFSKGMKKQVLVIIGVCAATKYLFCDETFDGLDPVMRQAVKSLFAAEIMNREFTPVIASHNLRELEDICDHVGLLHKGGILLSKDLEDMKFHIHKIQCVLSGRQQEKELEKEDTGQPEVLTKEEDEEQKLLEFVANYNSELEDSEYYYLPSDWEGRKLEWKIPYDTTGNMLAAIFLAAAFVMIVIIAREEQKARTKRYEELMMDYPGLIMKFTLLVQAGMTVRNTFRKMASDYKNKNEKRIAYEEIVTACHEMESGISEMEAYRRFGERCGHVKYKTFATLLIQNLQKGSRHMGEMLEKESVEAWDDRKRKAKVQGEAATTKLLFPMILMLGVVMAIVMLPACLSFYG